MISPEQITRTTCPYCGVGCTLDLHVRDNFIYKVTSPFDSVVNKCNLCVKGRFGYDFVYHPKRITKPMVRRYLLYCALQTIDRSTFPSSTVNVQSPAALV